VDGVNYFHVKVVGLLFVATTRVNVSPSLVLELLQRIARVIKDYLGVLNEDSLRKNFVLVYELLDEVIVSFLSCCLFCFINSSWLHVRCSICWCVLLIFAGPGLVCLLSSSFAIQFYILLYFSFNILNLWHKSWRAFISFLLFSLYKRNLKKE